MKIHRRVLMAFIQKYDGRTKGHDLIEPHGAELSKACLLRFFLAPCPFLPSGYRARLMSHESLEGKGESKSQK
jgi:hypothetical protein